MTQRILLTYVITATLSLFLISPINASSKSTLQTVQPFPEVGPIMRILKPTSVTFMGQGDIPHHHVLPHLHKKQKENMGVALLQSNTGEEQLHFFPMTAEDRHVGHLTVNNLTPEQEYTIKLGYTSLSKKKTHTMHTSLTLNDFNWDNAHTVNFTTPSQTPSETFSILAGSCRRIGLENIITGHFLHWLTEGDKTFEAMYYNLKEAQSRGEKTDSMEWFGDQMYADALGEFVKAAKTFEEFAMLYEKAFSQPHIRALLEKSGIPVHMMRDDHEFRNDGDAESGEKEPDRWEAAMDTYTLFQRPYGKNTENYWFETSNGVDIFHTDSRWERYPSKQQIISVEQMEALKAWASDPSRADRIKIIVTSVPFFLLPSDDSWNGFNKQRLELVDFFVQNNIKHMLILSGDAHCENDAIFKAYTPEGIDTGASFLEVLVSGFFAVSRHKADLLSNIADVKVDGHGYDMVAEPLGETLKENLFARISGNHDTKKVRVQIYNADNQLLKDKDYQL